MEDYVNKTVSIQSKKSRAGSMQRNHSRTESGNHQLIETGSQSSFGLRQHHQNDSQARLERSGTTDERVVGHGLKERMPIV